MHGGKRTGAGRKPSEKTVRISVPVGILDKVQALVESYQLHQQHTEQAIGRLLAGKVKNKNLP